MRRGVALLALVGLAIAGCGSDEQPDDGVVPAASPADFPAPGGRDTEQIYASVPPGDDYVVSPAGQVHREGRDRFAFGVFTAGREQITDAEVAIYAGPPNAPASGPYPARIETLATDPQFASKTTSFDPDAAQAIYVSEIKIDRPRGVADRRLDR